MFIYTSTSLSKEGFFFLFVSDGIAFRSGLYHTSETAIKRTFSLSLHLPPPHPMGSARPEGAIQTRSHINTAKMEMVWATQQLTLTDTVDGKAQRVIKLSHKNAEQG